jgi:transcriptional regulator of acetoin/glycerol metabolism
VVQQTVAAHGGNRAAAARQLGISRTTLWRYLGKLENGETDQT